MSHYRLKTKYKTEGPYGSEEECTLYAHHNLSCDYITFYDEDGSFIMTVPDTIKGNILDAINQLYAPFVKMSGALNEGIERMDEEDLKKCKMYPYNTPSK